MAIISKWSKVSLFVGSKSNVAQVIGFVSEGLKNILGKGENASLSKNISHMVNLLPRNPDF